MVIDMGVLVVISNQVDLKRIAMIMKLTQQTVGGQNLNQLLTLPELVKVPCD